MSSTSDEKPGRAFRTHERNGWKILVGKGAKDNDRLTFEIADRDDLWLHVSGWSGSHVILRVPDGSDEPPRDVVDFDAKLAAWHSKARGARGKVEVHICRAGDVRKPPGFAAGEVRLARFRVVKIYATNPEP